MTDIAASPTRPKIPVFDTAYDAYHLGVSAAFSSAKMFRFFVYGSVLWVFAFGIKYYDSLLRSGEITDTRPIALDVFVGILLTLLISVAQTPLGIALQRRILLGESPKGSYFGYLLAPAGIRYALVVFLVHLMFLCASLFPTLLAIALTSYMAPDQNDFAAIIRVDDLATSVRLISLPLLFAAAIGVSVRLAFAFPDAACRASPWLRQSIADTKGATLRLFLVYVFVSLPLGITYAVTIFAVGVAYGMRQNAAGSAAIQRPRLHVAGILLAGDGDRRRSDRHRHGNVLCRRCRRGGPCLRGTGCRHCA
jgi:hypothetical protein